MPKGYKIRRSTAQRGVYRARPHPLFVFLIVVAASGLGYLGFIIYPHIHSMIMSWGDNLPSITFPQMQPAEVEPELSDPAQAPGPARGLRGGTLRAIYAPPALVANAAEFDSFLESLSGSGLNAVMVDIKDRNGQVLFASRNRNANDWDAVVSGAVDLSALGSQLEERGFFLIVRMSAFRDETAARGNLNFAVNFRGPGTTWLDNFPNMGGRPWLNPHSEGARRYIADLAVEAAELGAVLVVLDDFQFPPNSLTGDAYFGDTGGISRAARLKDFADELTVTLAEHGARLAVYMPAIAIASGPNETFHGGPAENILSEHTALGTLPYQFPFGFTSEAFTLQNPLEDLNYTLGQIIPFVKTRTQSNLIALLQGGSLPGATQYTNAQIRGQINTLNRLGVREFIFYAPYVGHYQVTVGNLQLTADS